MQVIIISGPSGSGKTTLARKILKKLRNGIILNTDNYYKTGITSQILSKIVTSYFDRNMSFNSNLFKRDLNFILKNSYSEFSYKYDFKSKSISKIYKRTNKISFIIIEGIFGKEIVDNSLKNSILIELKISKNSCLKRVVKRDFIERGKNKNDALKDVLRSWEIFHRNKKKKNSRNFLKKYIINEKADIKLLIKKITSLVN